jgi:hypothetical protein
MVVDDSFLIAGRGVAVVGPFEGTGKQGDRAVVRVGDSEQRVDRVYFQYVIGVDPDGHRFEKVGIVLSRALDRLPAGAVVESED